MSPSSAALPSLVAFIGGTVLTGSLLAADGNPIVVVRDDHSVAKTPHQVFVHAPIDVEGESLGAPITSDVKFLKSEGGSPTWFVFPADVDGDDADEIVHVRHRPKKDSDIDVRAFLPPLFLDGEIGKPVGTSKKGSVGKGDGDGRVLLMAGGDHDGDGKDEAYVVREFTDGSQQLEIRPLPKKQNKKMAKVIASDLSFGDAFTDANLWLAAADIDDDEVDEVVVIRRGADLVERLFVFEPPQSPEGETGPAIRSTDSVAAADGAQIVSISRARTDPLGPDQLVLLRRHAALGVRLELLDVPVGTAVPLGDPVFTDLGLATATALDPPRTAFGLRGYHPTPPPPPPADISGQYETTFQHVLAGGEAESIDGLPLIQANQGGAQVAFFFPQFHQVVGMYSQAGATLDLSGTFAEIDLVGQGISYSLQLGVAKVSASNGVVTIQGTYTGTKKEPINQTTPLSGGVYVWKSQ